ncbi:hypothetical protein MC885_019018 [Smutsia gigantea]|nr:hypothetical protein MC885_019018 [Smutsia gigantea]
MHTRYLGSTHLSASRFLSGARIWPRSSPPRDENGEGLLHKRRKTPDANETGDHLKSLLKVGEKACLLFGEPPRRLGWCFEAYLLNYRSEILRFLCTVTRLLAEKLTTYATLVGLLNTRNDSCVGEFVEAMICQRLLKAVIMKLYIWSIF